VWLRISRACVIARLSRRGREKRPLLRSGESEDLSRRIAALLEEREPLYREAAHWEVIVDGRRSAQVAADIRRALWPSPGRR
jgi:shikimate kinase